jgi:hypothetical protein
MKRILSFAVALLLVAGTAFGWPLARVWKGGPSWWSGGLTFYAPFDNPADPLALTKGTGTLSFTRATTATQTSIDNGFISPVASGVLRIESAGALIEGQRTNLALQSSAFGTTWDNTNVTVDTDNTTSPDGTVNAELLTAFDANGTIVQDLGVIASAAKVFSVYLKRATGTGNIDLTLNGGTGWTTVAVTSSWARYSITATLADPDVGIRIVTSGDAVYAYGGQVEAATFASSLIPTTTAAVTRNADVLSFTSSGNISATAGTFSATSKINGPTGSTAYSIWMSTNETNNRLAARIYSNSYLEYGTGSSTITVNAGGVTSGTQFKLAVAWDSTGGWAVKDGGTVASNTTDPSINIDATSYIGTRVGTANHLYGHVKNMRIWNRKFTDAELQMISTP